MIKKLRNLKLTPGLILRLLVGLVVLIYLGWRIYQTAFGEVVYGPDTWMRFLITGLVVGGMYALIAIGYTLVYGILFMINFAHGEVMMLGTFAGYFVLEAFSAIPAPLRRGPNPELPECLPGHRTVFDLHRRGRHFRSGGLSA